MNLELKKTILDKIRQYDRIIISRHQRPDGDAVGSTKGLCGIIKASFPEKQVLVINEDYSDYVSFLGPEDEQIPDEDYKDALVMVLDCGNVERISNSKYNLGKELIKIDHHVDHTPYGDISWVEDTRSSVCEMITDFYMTFENELTLDKESATCLYTGMMTDSGRFKYEGTTGDTLRCGAVLLDKGIETDILFARLYLEDFDYLKYQAYAFKKMKQTANGVCYLYVDDKMQQQFNLTPEQASNSVSLLADIKGCIIWIAFISNADSTIRVRLRSRFVAVNGLAEKYGGGGHICASGATVKNRKEMNALLKEADALIKEFKDNNFYL